MASRVVGQARRPIVVVGTYLAIQFVSIVGSIAFDPKVQNGTIRSRGIVALGVGLLLLVLFNLALYRRHRWAGYLSIVVYVIGVVSILWEPVKPLTYAVSVVELALLLSSPMRQYIYEGRWHAAAEA
jgi:hypothetical protein